MDSTSRSAAFVIRILRHKKNGTVCCRSFPNARRQAGQIRRFISWFRGGSLRETEFSQTFLDSILFDFEDGTLINIRSSN